MSRYVNIDDLPRHGKRGGVVYWRDIEAQPTADVVEVVRCKDCKHFGEDIQGTGLCSLGGQLEWAYMNTMYADDFCSYGERAEE